MRALLNICLMLVLLLRGYSIISPDKHGINNNPAKAKSAAKSGRYTVDEIMSIRIYSQFKINTFIFSPAQGSYILYGDGKPVDRIDNTNALKIGLYGNDSIEVHMVDARLGKFKTLKLVAQESERSFKLRLVAPDKKPRYYQGELSVTVENKLLRVINFTRLDDYIAGVSEAEAGKHSHAEFYKVQAILARTYALGHIHKHAEEGYNLCDQVHCQVFYGITNDLVILDAVKQTRGQVVVDEDLQLITAVFHSNSGGQTVNSEDVWGANTSYLRSITDSFSLKMPNARWQRKMATEDWLSYLKLRYNYPVDDSAARNYALNFKQESRRTYLEYTGVKIPLKNVRTDFQLKSTFFSITNQGDSLLFSGKGFGHGIGMCQEGAMCMTKCGYTYKQVLNFYYQKVVLLDIKEMAFFKEN